MRSWLRLESVDDIRHPRAYLFQVARSVITRHVRRARIVAIHAVDDLERLEHPDEAASPERRTIDRDELRQLAKAIAAMPLKTREAFVLRRVRACPSARSPPGCGSRRIRWRPTSPEASCS
ncbi:RNA polymerase sigma factor [Caulobacter segnis]